MLALLAALPRGVRGCMVGMSGLERAVDSHRPRRCMRTMGLGGVSLARFGAAVAVAS